MKWFRNYLSSFVKDESGAVLILVALTIIILMGMTALSVDGGRLYQTRRDMVNAADAAALAGAQELIFASNNQQVVNFAENFAINNYDCDPGQVEATVINSYTVGVKTGKNVDLTFARILGFTNSDVTAYAEAVFTPLENAGNIVPWAVPNGWLPDGWDDHCTICGELIEDCTCEEDDEVEYDLVYLKLGPPGRGGQTGEIGPGNFHALALGGPGADRYRTNIKEGYDGGVEIGKCYDTEPGVEAGPTAQGVQYRIDQCNHSPSPNSICSDRSCPRFVTVIVFDEESTDTQGKTKVCVIGFATVYLLRVIPEGQNKLTVEGFFVGKFIGEGSGTKGFNPSNDFGTYNLRLIE